ncbi:transposase DNA-binding-containing protein [Phycisphaerales bacterium AB-hyl4]|uniref:Transposase DNA-binding-containing protein n=1 Tax=Natronomicrosphaera hydrolytica TaxID=3242702 RepID=A0ABV4UAV9_9BACT
MDAWIQDEVSASAFPDQRLSKRFVKLLEDLSQRIGDPSVSSAGYILSAVTVNLPRAIPCCTERTPMPRFTRSSAGPCRRYTTLASTLSIAMRATRTNWR